MKKTKKDLNPQNSAVKPSVLYIFLGSIFLFAMIMFLSSCSTKEDDPQPGLSIRSFNPATGSPGETVVIVGSEFDEDAENNTVSFNNVPGVVTVATKTSLTVTIPPDAQSGKITVTVNAKTASSATDFVVVQ